MKAASVLRTCMHGRIIQRRVEEQDKLNAGSCPGDADEEQEQEHGEIRQFARISVRSRRRRGEKHRWRAACHFALSAFLSNAHTHTHTHTRTHTHTCSRVREHIGTKIPYAEHESWQARRQALPSQSACSQVLVVRSPLSPCLSGCLCLSVCKGER